MKIGKYSVFVGVCYLILKFLGQSPWPEFSALAVGIVVYLGNDMIAVKHKKSLLIDFVRFGVPCGIMAGTSGFFFGAKQRIVVALLCSIFFGVLFFSINKFRRKK